MEFVRQVVAGNALGRVLDLPPSLRDVEVEVIVLPVAGGRNGLSGADTRPRSSVVPETHKAFGRLRAYANPALIPKEPLIK